MKELKRDNLVLITWNKFKAFFHKELENFQAFFNNYLAKIKRDL